MADKKAIMNWLEGLAEPDWRLFHSDSEVQTIAKETLDLLKEQEQRINELEEKLRLLEYGDQDILQSGMMPAT